MSMQETFDKVATHLLKQNARSTEDRDGDSCLYRDPAGRSCAVGCLIPDEKYTPEMEGGPIRVRGGNLVWEALPEEHRHERLLADLQYMHDAYYPNEWPERLRHVASEFGLSTEVLRR